ncbi:hypothetical protein [Microbacterium laevaniformans]
MTTTNCDPGEQDDDDRPGDQSDKTSPVAADTGGTNDTTRHPPIMQT